MFLHEKTPNLVPIDQLDQVKVKGEERLELNPIRPTGGYDVCIRCNTTCSHVSLTLGLGWVALQLSWPKAWIPFGGR